MMVAKVFTYQNIESIRFFQNAKVKNPLLFCRSINIKIKNDFYTNKKFP